MSITIASWNINSLRLRLPLLESFLSENDIDILCLQETKTPDDKFPEGAIENLGYNVAYHGQKSYNGVAILSKYPIDGFECGLEGNDKDEQARFIEAYISLNGTSITIASLYMPNGNPTNSEKYDYKLSFMDRLNNYCHKLLQNEEKVALIGDFNVIPHDDDVYDPKLWENDALFTLDTRKKYYSLLNQGWYEAFRACNNLPSQFSFWGYQKGAWQKDNGLRIDHILLSPILADNLENVEIIKQMRAQTKPSDHVPITASFSL